MKKAFCEPGNTSFCPPIAIASAFALAGGVTVQTEDAAASLLVQRSVENGGDRNYKTVAELEDDFGKESLHPGDLKAAVSNVMVGVLERLSNALKTDSAASKATKDLKAFAKKMSKMKK